MEKDGNCICLDLRYWLPWPRLPPRQTPGAAVVFLEPALRATCHPLPSPEHQHTPLLSQRLSHAAFCVSWHPSFGLKGIFFRYQGVAYFLFDSFILYFPVLLRMYQMTLFKKNLTHAQ